MSPIQSQPATRPAVHAGRFYDANPERLRTLIRRLLDEAAPAKPPAAGQVRGLLAPHAGYVYSGRIAAAAYACVSGERFNGVLILAPSHYGNFTGAALASSAAFETPLGNVALDLSAVDELRERPGFEINDAAHANEHSIEVQLPLLQVALAPGFKIVPVALGRQPEGGIGSLVQALGRWLESRRAEGQRWLILASSDTYHGYDGSQCEMNDEALSRLVAAMDPGAIEREVSGRRLMACGWLALVTTMELVRAQGVTEGRLLARGDSRQAASRASDYVVGYLAAAFVDPGREQEGSEK